VIGRALGNGVFDRPITRREFRERVNASYEDWISDRLTITVGEAESDYHEVGGHLELSQQAYEFLVREGVFD